VNGFERTTLLRRHGYSAQEAEFLCLAADAGGYFLRQHFRRFRGTTKTRAEAKLSHKLAEKRHAHIYLGPRDLELFHLSARSFYRLIESSASRNRRQRPESAIRRRLLTLDYLLANRGQRFLLNDAEKLSYLAGERDISRGILPLTGSRFIDPQPVHVGPASPDHPPVVSFCLVESKAFNMRRFRSFLDRHRRLWEQLRAFRLVYVTDRKWNSPLAERAFRSFVQGHWPPSEASKPTFREQIIAAFKAQFAVQTGRESRLNVPDKILVREVKDRLTDARFNELYTTWVLTSDRCVYDLVPPDPFELWPTASFSAHVIDADYGFLTA
jgi:hypothetical protein